MRFGVAAVGRAGAARGVLASAGRAGLGCLPAAAYDCVVALGVHRAVAGPDGLDDRGVGPCRVVLVAGLVGPEAVLLAERLVDLEQHLLLPLVERGIGEYDGARLHLVPVPLGVEDAGADVQRLGGDPQGLGDLLQHLRARLAQSALDLAQVRIGHPGGVGELPERQLRVAPLLAQVLTEIADVERCHDSTVHPCANYCKQLLAIVR